MKISSFGVRKKPRKHPESEICKALWHWFFYAFPKHRRRYLRIEVGGQRTKKTQGILKAEGVKAGTSDIFVAVPRGAFGGLWLEVKADKGRLSDNQKTFQNEMGDDYRCVTGYGLRECKDLITQYLNS